MKYIFGIGVLVAAVAGYLLLVAPGDPPVPVPQPEPAAPEPVRPPETVAPQAAAPEAVAPVDQDPQSLLEEMAADFRDALPEAVSETLTLTDAVFLPRMRIMEFIYVTGSADTRAAAIDLRALIEARSETICREGREMFAMGATLRHSFATGDGNLFQRVYLLPEDCARFY